MRYKSIFISTIYHFLSQILNKEIERNTCDFLLLFCIATKYMAKPTTENVDIFQVMI